MARNELVSLNIESDMEDVINNNNLFMSRIPQVQRGMTYQIAKIFKQEIFSMFRVRFDDVTGQSSNTIKNAPIIPIKMARMNSFGHRLVLERPFGHGRKGDLFGWNEFAKKGHPVTVSPDNAPIMRMFDSGEKMPHKVFVHPRPFVRAAIRPATRRMRNVASEEIGDALNKMFGS